MSGRRARLIRAGVLAAQGLRLLPARRNRLTKYAYAEARKRQAVAAIRRMTRTADEQLD